jgi:cytochrome c553
MSNGLRIAAAIATWLAGAGVAAAYPGGTPDFQSNVLPYCAACHSSVSEEALAGVPGDRAVKEVAEHKHLAAIAAGARNYGQLSEADRARLVEWVRAVDAHSTIELDFPPQVAPGETFQVTVRVAGGAGPAVGAGLVDRAHRWFAKSAESAGWRVVGAPTVIGPQGEPQSAWLARRPERVGRNITFVNITDWKSDAVTGKWARGKVIYTLRAPDVPGDYPLVAFFLYGTETAIPLSTQADPMYGDQPLGGYTGKSGRVRFTEEHVITVK